MYRESAAKHVVIGTFRQDVTSVAIPQRVARGLEIALYNIKSSHWPGLQLPSTMRAISQAILMRLNYGVLNSTHGGMREWPLE